ncbi:MAG: hypothetical protein ACO3LE_08425 [Bdellovibrionota bacterium]
MNNWIPRSLRWNDDERAARRIASKNAREYAQMLWNEKENFRQSIEKEIEQKKLASIQASA